MTNNKQRAGGFILIVEDDRGTRELEAQCLAPLRLEIRRAANAQEAENMLKTATPALMLLDYSLPDANAVELVKKLRADGVTVPPFLVVTGRGDEAVAVETMKAGAQDYITKNADFLDNLLPSAKKALAQVEVLKELKAAQLQADLLSQAIKNSFNEVYLFDAAAFRFVFANNGAINNLGYSQKELEALAPWDLQKEFTEAAFRLKVAPLLRGEAAILFFESAHTRKDGTAYPVEERLQFINTQPAPVFLAVLNDISDRKRAAGLPAK